MRNLFDQYTQPENRLTHALLASLEADPRLLRDFIRWAVPESRPRGRLSVLEQALPGAPEDVSGTEEDERKGLPDGWIHDREGWALLLESKVAAAPDSDQIRRQLDAYPKHPGRGAIKGKGGTAVWDFLALRDLKGSPIFTRSPHLTLGITESQLEAYVTVPNGMPGRLRTQLLGKEYEAFAETIHQCTAQLERALGAVRGANLFFVIVQRRYPSMAAVPILDMKMIFDPRTAFPGGPRGARNRPRFQPEWLRAAYEALRHRKSNLQFQIGAAFPYDSWEAVRMASIAEVVAKTWIACRPVIEAGRERKGKGK